VELVFNFGIFLILLLVGLFVGGWQERRHFASILRREQQMAETLVTQIKSFPDSVPGDPPPMIMVAEVVVGTDYLKSFLARLRNIFGGEVRSYQSLLERARREAALRILARARHQGYNAVCNMRFETADVGGNSTMRTVAMVAIMATGTAYHAAEPPT
jgi:uncharacterized protein YbjQ (UPF0145 family)